MRYLLDTNVCIALLRQSSSSVVTRLNAVQASDVLICSIVVTELHFGALRSAKVAANLIQVNALIAGFQSLAFDDAAAIVHARLHADLASRGELIGPHDLLIAAIALANDLTLVTHNTAEFARVPNLKLEDWQTP